MTSQVTRSLDANFAYTGRYEFPQGAVGRLENVVSATLVIILGATRR